MSTYVGNKSNDDNDRNNIYDETAIQMVFVYLVGETEESQISGRFTNLVITVGADALHRPLRRLQTTQCLLSIGLRDLSTVFWLSIKQKH